MNSKVLSLNYLVNETCGNYTSKCQCDIYEVDVNGTCMPCMSDHCFLCEFGDPYSCEACSPGYELNDDNECVP